MPPARQQRNRSLQLHLFWAAVLLGGCGQPQQTAERPADLSTSEAVVAAAPQTFAELEAVDSHATSVRQFCGSCHSVPLPQSFPRDAWYEEVRRGFDFYYQSGRSDLTPPTAQEVTAFYRKYAPVQLALPDWADDGIGDVRFSPQPISITWPTIKTPAAVSFVDIRSGRDGKNEIWFSDMRSGAAGQVVIPAKSVITAVSDPATSDLPEADPPVLPVSLNGVARFPVAARTADLDGNGIDDLIFCDLGSFLPEDHDQGRLLWVPDGTGAVPGKPVVLLDHVGRVAEVCAADFNNDGITDLVVGEFGWHKTGGIHLLTGTGVVDGVPTFSRTVLDERPGTIHIIPTDIDNNGTLDFIALISQEHEQVVAFLNEPDGFRRELVYAAPDPSWGSSGISMVDFDQDGDNDLLYTNGDTFDSYLTKPYHGVWWLENTGAMPWKAHRLAALPGVHRALAHDMDGDGDLDVVAAALLPSTSSRNIETERLQALIWLEQIQPGEFRQRVIEHGRPIYAAIAIQDLDFDNRPDIVAGCFHEDGDPTAPVLKIFWNEAASSRTTDVEPASRPGLASAAPDISR